MEDGLFWHHSFQLVSEEAYRELQRSLLGPEALQKGRGGLILGGGLAEA